MFLHPLIHSFDSLPSTNATLKEMATLGAREGTVVMAKSQTAGRGRGERKWASPQGGLYFSLLLFPNQNVTSRGRPTDLSLLTGAVLSQTLKMFFPSEISIGVKWPNDCLLEGKKVAGVLCEAMGEGEKGAVIVGVGVNVNVSTLDLEPFRVRPFKATSFQEVAPQVRVKPEQVLATFLQSFSPHYEQYRKQGFRYVQVLWERECTHLGRQIEIRETGQAPKEKDRFQGVMLGIDDQGALVLSQPGGERKTFVTGEITCCW